MALAGLFVGFVVGLTGMGGGALMTPILVMFFHVPPLAAVSSDLVASLLMKPIGGAVHARRGTVNRQLVLWLCAGSVPAAFGGVLVLRAFGDGEQVQQVVKFALGVAILVAAATIVLKSFVTLWQRARELRLGLFPDRIDTIVVRPVPTVLVGVLGGFVVGMTSVGSGSLIIVLLLMLYPRIKAAQLVGTDLVQAVPLVGAAALGHALFGEVRLDITTSLLLGSIPGVYVGARLSSSAPQSLVRRALVVVLLASGLKLVGVETAVMAWILVAVIVLGPLAWMLIRRSLGLPARGGGHVPQQQSAGERAVGTKL